MQAEINEKIRVVTLFEEGKIKPFLFSWHKKIYKVLQVPFSYSKDIGKDKMYFFSIQTEGGGFEISFNSNKFSWEITKTL